MENQHYQPANLILNHKSGSKSSQSQTFSLSGNPDISIGRSNQSDVAYDPTNDTVVSRQHAQITADPSNPGHYLITDLNSSNGTYVNGKKLQGSVAISHGDTVSLGENGPSFGVSFDPPPPDNYAGATRLINVPEEAAATKVISSKEVFEATAEKVADKTTVGKETVERMVASAQTKQKTNFMYILGAVALIAAMAIGYLVFFPDEEEPSGILTTKQIFDMHKDKVVFIELSWKLTYTQTGGEVYHEYVQVDKDKIAARYIQLADGTVEPYLTTEKGPYDRLIGNSGAATGFLISGEGHILTNRHVAAAWGTRYSFPQAAFPGVILTQNEKKELVVARQVGPQDVMNWVPENSKQQSKHWTSPTQLVGVNSRLDVTFPGSNQRTTARVIRVSPVHDVAMINIDLPGTQDALTLSEEIPVPQPGEKVIAIGYPGASPEQYSMYYSKDIFNKNQTIVSIPVPSVSDGVISKIINSDAIKKSDYIIDVHGDYFQVDINTGGGNSGGPVLNDKGELVGIISGGTRPGSDFSYGLTIPIKYGIDLAR